MERISWDTSFSVGVHSIDEQHKRLINMPNKMIDAPDATVESETISDTLTKMTEYTQEHFEAEEQLMEEYKYPDLPTHREVHRAFQEKAATLCIETMDGKTEVPADILDYLKKWWTQHILVTDMKYKDFFEERGVRGNDTLE